MKDQIIKRSDLKQIYNIACKDWKLKLEQYAKRSPFGDEIQLTGEEIDEMFAVSDIEQKKVLDKFFVRERNITDKIKTFADACIECGTTEEIFYHYLNDSHYRKDTVAYEQLFLVVKALNEGWLPNWNDSSEYKYYPYFKMSPFGFAAAGCGHWATTSITGSRLCFKSKELAEYAGKQFENIYKDFIV